MNLDSVKLEANDPLIYRRLAATHVDILSIGANVEKKCKEIVEEERQKTIRSTEEVIRREEESKRLEALSKAADEAQRQKELLLEEATKERLLAIVEANAVLTAELKQQEELNIKLVRGAEDKRLQQALKDASIEASKRQDEAVALARAEEQESARKEAERVAQITEDRRIEASLQAEEEQRKALENQEQQLSEKHVAEMKAKEQELQQTHANEMDKLKQDYDTLLSQLNSKLQEEQGINSRLTADLQQMTLEKEDWEKKYQNLKVEFSHFIDQFPGFRGEFILK
ncbi:uncharacterized protein C6orf163-like [Dysidea avara]|uniref:uncharacterized protein C6orf163-like n=1 Tax=Dysidea avara TaxID=196820 RepID=UPI00332CC50B